MKYKIYKYNELTGRLIKAEKWLESPEVSVEEAEKWMPQLKEIIKELNVLFMELRKSGVKVKAGELILR